LSRPDHDVSRPACVHHLLETTTDKAPDQVVLEHGSQQYHYHDLEEEANRVASFLLAQGVERGDRVALLLDNGYDYVAGFFGILKAGACCVALNSSNKTRTTALLLEDSGAVGLLTRGLMVKDDLPEIAQAAEDLRFVLVDRAAPTWTLPDRTRLVLRSDVAEAPTERHELPLTGDDLCAILYTSGSTGRPRGVTLSHGNLTANTAQILAYLELQADDSVLSVLPFHYSFGNSLLLTHVKVGGRVVVDNRFAYPATIVEALEERRVTSFAGVPSTYAILTSRTDFLQRSWPDLRYLTQAGGAMTPALQRRLVESLPEHLRLFIMYGQTEAGARLSWLPPELLPTKYGSIGRGIPGVELTVRHQDGTICGMGEVGEVVASGPNIMQGYWNDPDETALVLKQGRLHTGDLGRRDEDGDIWLVDRIKNMIKAGANRVSAKEIEETIAEVAGVQEVCVVGIPDELLGEAIEAFVVPQPGHEYDLNGILQHCRRHLALYKIPRTIHRLDTMPRSAAGKVLKQELLNLR